MLHISGVRFLNDNNTRYTDIKSNLKKETACTKKRFLHQRDGKNGKKTPSCTERLYQSSVVVKVCKTTIYRYREQKSTRKTKKDVREENYEEGKSVTSKIQCGNNAIVYTICTQNETKITQRRFIVVQSGA